MVDRKRMKMIIRDNTDNEEDIYDTYIIIYMTKLKNLGKTTKEEERIQF